MKDAERDAAVEGWQSADTPRFNLAVLGATGVGKSTLINAVFGREVARTGIGRPVTKGVQFYQSETLGLYDFEGAESFEELDSFVRNFRVVYRERLEEDPASAVHVIWYCVKAADRRFDDHQETLLAQFRAMSIPVILVVTQTPWLPDRGMDPSAQAFLDHLGQRGLPAFSIDPVSAIDDDFAGTKAFGLQQLLDDTTRAAPEGVRQALAAAQHIDARSKRGEAQKVVAAASALAAAVAATPLPGADAPALVAIQFEMMRRIARIFNIHLTVNTAIAALSGSIATYAGRSVVGQLSKLIPGAGQVINASVAGGLTAVLGSAWLLLCEQDWLGEISVKELVEQGELGDVLRDFLKQQSAAKAHRS